MRKNFKGEQWYSKDGWIEGKKESMVNINKGRQVGTIMEGEMDMNRSEMEY